MHLQAADKYQQFNLSMINKIGITWKHERKKIKWQSQTNTNKCNKENMQ